MTINMRQKATLLEKWLRQLVLINSENRDKHYDHSYMSYVLLKESVHILH